MSEYLHTPLRKNHPHFVDAQAQANRVPQMSDLEIDVGDQIFLKPKGNNGAEVFPLVCRREVANRPPRLSDITIKLRVFRVSCG